MAIAKHDIQVVFFDFSGVLAEEGFVQGLKEIGRQHGREPAAFLRQVTEICYNNGYADGRTDEHAFWQDVREQMDITAGDDALRREILSRFVVRPWMLQAVSRVRSDATRTALLSDHTNWLEELDAAHGIYRHFDRIFNSYREGMTKRSPDFFLHACNTMQVAPDNTLFIDDNPANTDRAEGVGMHAILYTAYPSLVTDLKRFLPSTVLPPEGAVC
ncbi:HAD family hydrolase [Desulfovibrio subterraneus]|uniref:Haloacid dehalogenase n=1 Tax=Desulfovibrio subterraneus TaxID=2718620 RepID=A0A7J0BGL5_9BACT|nr:HAD family phosphatase [Desulfovibrio subterraneus]GFM32332.1 haloacid dehalogenase [Desulfovibrio subterraneus]